MIIPAVYVFSGLEGMSAGPGLMFISLPNVFYSMGLAGRIIGLMFFILTAFAALTSCISVLESITANCMELFHEMCIRDSYCTSFMLLLQYNNIFLLYYLISNYDHFLPDYLQNKQVPSII